MEPIGLSRNVGNLASNLRCVTSQKSDDLIYTPAKGWSHWFFLLKNVLTIWLSVLFSGYRDSFLVTKRPGREANSLPPSSAAIKNKCSCIPTSAIRLSGIDRDKFVLLLQLL